MRKGIRSQFPGLFDLEAVMLDQRNRTKQGGAEARGGGRCCGTAESNTTPIEFSEKTHSHSQVRGCLGGNGLGEVKAAVAISEGSRKDDLAAQGGEPIEG